MILSLKRGGTLQSRDMEQGMNDTLKAAGRIGAELGAAKAENEKLRGLLRDAKLKLSPHFQTRTATGTAQAEPPPAQDEREAYSVWRDSNVQKGRTDTNGYHAFKAGAAWQRTRPAQAEQQPVSWTSLAKLKAVNDVGVASMWSERVADDTDVALYAAPIAQTAPQSDCEWCAGAGHDPFGGKCQHCKTAPQPEQSGLVEALEEIASGLQAEFAWEVAEQALAAYRASLSAQGAGDASA